MDQILITGEDRLDIVREQQRGLTTKRQVAVGASHDRAHGQFVRVAQSDDVADFVHRHGKPREPCRVR